MHTFSYCQLEDFQVGLGLPIRRLGHPEPVLHHGHIDLSRHLTNTRFSLALTAHSF